MMTSIKSLAVAALLGAATLTGAATLSSGAAEAGYKFRHYGGHKFYGHKFYGWGHKFHHGYVSSYGWKPHCKVWSYGGYKCLKWY